MKVWRRWLSAMLAAVLLITAVPMNVLASEGDFTDIIEDNGKVAEEAEETAPEAEEPVAVPAENEEPTAIPIENEESAAVPDENEEPAAVPTENEEPAAVPTETEEPAADADEEVVPVNETVPMEEDLQEDEETPGDIEDTIAEDEGPQDIVMTLNVKETAVLTSDDPLVRFLFTPEEDGSYLFLLGANTGCWNDYSLRTADETGAVVYSESCGGMDDGSQVLNTAVSTLTAGMEYAFCVSYCGYSAAEDISLEIVKNPVVGLAVDDFSILESAGYYQEESFYNEETGSEEYYSYYRYSCVPRTVAVTLADGEVLTGYFDEIENELYSRYQIPFGYYLNSDQNYDHQWEPGKEYTVTYIFAGQTAECQVQIIRTADYAIDLGLDMETETVELDSQNENAVYQFTPEESGQYYFWVKSSDGNHEIRLTDVSNYPVDTLDTQWGYTDGYTKECQLYTLEAGKTYYYSVTRWAGKDIDAVSVRVAKNPVVSVSVEDVVNLDISGEERTEAVYDEETGTEREETYIYYDISVREITVRTEDGDEISGNPDTVSETIRSRYDVYFSYWPLSEQSAQNPWQAGNTYEAEFCFSGLTVPYHVTIQSVNDQAEPLTIGEETAVTVDEAHPSVYASFTPEETGSYILRIASDHWVGVYLYDADYNDVSHILSATDWWDPEKQINVRGIACLIEAGEKYYWRIDYGWSVEQEELTLSIVKNPVASLSVQDKMIFNTEKQLQTTYIYDEETGEETEVSYYVYDIWADLLTVTTLDGRTITGTEYEVNNELQQLYGVRLSFQCESDQSYENQWETGETYLCRCSLGGVTGEYHVKIVDFSDGASEIQLDETKTVTLSRDGDRYVCYSYTPEETGRYIVAITLPGSGISEFSMYDSQLNRLDSSSSYGWQEDDGRNSKSGWFSLEAGETYYFGIFNEGTAEETVDAKIIRNPILSMSVPDIYLLEEFDRGEAEDYIYNSDTGEFEYVQYPYYDASPKTVMLTFTDGETHSGDPSEINLYLYEKYGIQVSDYFNDPQDYYTQWQAGESYEVYFYLGDFAVPYHVVIQTREDRLTELEPDKDYSFGLSIEYNRIYCSFTPEESGSYIFILGNGGWSNYIYLEKDSQMMQPDMSSDRVVNGIWNAFTGYYLEAGTTYSFSIYGTYEISVKVIKNPIASVSVEDTSVSVLNSPTMILPKVITVNTTDGKQFTGNTNSVNDALWENYGFTAGCYASLPEEIPDWEVGAVFTATLHIGGISADYLVTVDDSAVNAAIPLELDTTVSSHMTDDGFAYFRFTPETSGEYIFELTATRYLGYNTPAERFYDSAYKEFTFNEHAVVDMWEKWGEDRITSVVHVLSLEAGKTYYYRYGVYMYYDPEDSITLTVRENPVVSIEASDITLSQEDYEIENDYGVNQDWKKYLCDPASVSVRTTDGKIFSGTMKEVDEALSAEYGITFKSLCWSEQSYHNQWAPGGTYDATVRIAGKSAVYRVSIEPEIMSGKCGDQLNWAYTMENRKLTVSGSGEMYDYNWGPEGDSAPWVKIGGMANAVIGDGALSIGSWAFASMRQLTGVTIPEGVQRIGENAFAGCVGLTDVLLPDSITSIEYSSFAGCTSLASVALPDSVTRIEYGTFAGCSSLASVSIPSTVAQISNSAFGSCNSITDVYYDASDEDWGEISIQEGNEALSAAVLHWTPVITGQPENTTVAAGERAAFKVVTRGTGLKYQWYYSKDNGKTWTKWNNKVTARVSVPGSETNTGCLYKCLVSNDFTTVSSEAARLTVSDVAPMMLSQPKDVTVKFGEEAEFSVVAGGSGLSYQWYYSKNGGASWTRWTRKDASFTVKGSATNNGCLYRCVVTNSAGSVTSEAAMLTVLPDFAITGQPEDTMVALGESASFSVTANGTGLSYQWYYSKNGGASWTKWSGKTAASFTIKGSTTNNGCLYRCVITGGSGSITSEAAMLTVEGVKPTILSQPSAVTAEAGQTVVFEVEAAGKDLSYQWQYSKNHGATWTDCKNEGYDTARFSFTVKAGLNGRMYRCVVRNSAGSTKSAGAMLTVDGVKPAILTQPSDQTAEAGAAVVFKVSAAGTDLTYQWQYSKDNGSTWADCKGEGYDQPEFGFTAAAKYSGRMYRCIIKNASGSVTSDAAVFTVK